MVVGYVATGGLFLIFFLSFVFKATKVTLLLNLWGEEGIELVLLTFGFILFPLVLFKRARELKFGTGGKIGHIQLFSSVSKEHQQASFGTPRSITARGVRPAPNPIASVGLQHREVEI